MFRNTFDAAGGRQNRNTIKQRSGWTGTSPTIFFSCQPAVNVIRLPPTLWVHTRNFERWFLFFRIPRAFVEKRINGRSPNTYARAFIRTDGWVAVKDTRTNKVRTIHFAIYLYTYKRAGISIIIIIRGRSGYNNRVRLEMARDT